jgi:two-component sensor histidine kinase
MASNVRPRLNLRLRLALLVAGTTLPLILFSATIIYLDYETNRRIVSERTLGLARLMAHTVDRELQSTAAALQVLALSLALQRDDFAAFRAQVGAFLGLYLAGTNVTVASRDGQQVFNAAIPPGDPLPRRSDTATVDAVFATGRPVISNLYTSVFLQRPIFTIDVPVVRDGAIVYALSMNPPLERFGDILRQQGVQEGWVISVFDRAGVNVARTPNPERFVGQRAAPSLFRDLQAKPEGVVETTSLEGIPLLTAFARSPGSGWRVAIGIPRRGLTDPLWRSLAVTVVVGAVFRTIGLGFAVRMARRIAQAEAHRALLIDELNHRVKNTLAVVQAIAARTFANVPATSAARQAFEARLIALAQAHNVLSDEHWEAASLHDILGAVLKPHVARGRGRDRFVIDGPDVRLPPQTAIALGMALHELATNAAKYGALSTSQGRVFITWSLIEAADGPHVALTWREAGGPAVRPPERKGFGTTLIERGFPGESGGAAVLQYEPAGLTATFDVPLGTGRPFADVKEA